MTVSAPPKVRNAAATRANILRAARDSFGKQAYEQVGLREIGADAGIDAALICRYFGSKEELFAEALASTGKEPMQTLGGDRATFGDRVARTMLVPDDQTTEQNLAFINLAIRSAASPVAHRLVRRHVEECFIVPFAAWLGGEDGEARARLVASVLLGVAIVRGVLFSPLEVSEDEEAAIARLARVLQDIIDADEG